MDKPDDRRLTQLRRIAKDIKKREELDASLRTARREQLHMLPKIPQIAGYGFATYYLPAGEIGGDFYDFVNIIGNKLGIMIGDVTGHGVEAAIIMGMAKKTMAIYSRGASNPAETLISSNGELYGEMLPSRFVSASMVFLDVTTHTLQFARAGHNPLIVYNPQRPEAIFEISSKGTVLGIIKSEQFAKTLEMVTLQLYGGDFVLQYTDGITEAHSPSNEEFGIQRLKDAIATHYSEPLEKMLENIVKTADDFVEHKEFHDDITLVAFRVGG
jgi:sigma-B regulation protein RsbU (phosphoserine phosphatase)